jgi:hypothetical protein
MNIKTKFSVNDQVFFLHDGAIIKGNVRKIVTETTARIDKLAKDEDQTIVYYCQNVNETCTRHHSRLESALAATLEELIVVFAPK